MQARGGELEGEEEEGADVVVRVDEGVMVTVCAVDERDVAEAGAV